MRRYRFYSYRQAGRHWSERQKREPLNDGDYKPPFPLTAKLNKLTIKVDRPELSPEDIKKLENAEAEALDGKPLRHVQAGPQ